MFSLLISGPRQLGNNIEIYLAPLVDDLKKLWFMGVETYDAYKENSFTLQAMLMWIINDFLTYGNLLGYGVKGYCACPIYGDGTCGSQLKHGMKIVCMRHHR